MIATASTEKVMFLSVALRDGSMEAFADINDAVAHATALVRDDDTERAIFVAVPRARVRRAVRVEPVDPPPMPGTEQPEVPRSAVAWEQSEDLVPATDGHEPVMGERCDTDEERDLKPIGVLATDLAALGSKLSRAQRDYERARARGDEERVNDFKLQVNAIATELNRLRKYLSTRQPTTARRQTGRPE
jgi:hypothetical protein